MPRSFIHYSLAFALLLSLTFSVCINARAQANNTPRTVRLAVVQGDVQVQRAGENTRVKATPNMAIDQGFTLYTGEGMAEIYFEDGATGYLGDNSALQFTELGASNTGRVTRLDLTQGDARFFANTRNVNVFSVKTPNFTVSPNPLVDFHVAVHGGGSEVAVHRGEASVKDNAQTLTADRGQTVSFPAGAAEAKLMATPPGDEFESWFPVIPFYQPYSAFPIGPPATIVSPPSAPEYYPPPYPRLPRPVENSPAGPHDPR